MLWAQSARLCGHKVVVHAPGGQQGRDRHAFGACRGTTGNGLSNSDKPPVLPSKLRYDTTSSSLPNSVSMLTLEYIYKATSVRFPTSQVNIPPRIYNPLQDIVLQQQTNQTCQKAELLPSQSTSHSPSVSLVQYCLYTIYRSRQRVGRAQAGRDRPRRQQWPD